MRQAHLGNKHRYLSDAGRGYSRNLRGPKEALKQANHETMRINWIVVLARGRVAIEMSSEDWALNGDGMAHVVASLPGILRRMLGARSTLPRTLWTNRGTGMYSPRGMVVHAYAGAAASAGFRLYWGDNARLTTKGPRKGDESERAASLNSSPEMETWFVSRVMLKISILLCVGRRCTDKRLTMRR